MSAPVLGDAMYFDGDTWKELVHLAATKTQTPRYARYFALSQVAFGALRGLVAAGRRVDDVLYPGWRDQPVREPFFIFANARSGTTLLHRLMSLDTERFTYSKLYESLFQSVVAHRLIEAGVALDARLGRHVGDAVERVDERIFRVWKDIHPMGLNQAEEDEAYFVFSLLTPGLYPFFPYPRELERVSWLDRLGDEVVEAVMDDYEGAVKRLLYVQGLRDGKPNRQLLSKSVFLQGRLDAFRERFPDGRFVYLVRHPYESIPSFVSMFVAIWRLHSPEIPDDSDEARALAKIAIDFYRRGLEARREFGPSQFLTVKYAQLTSDPGGTVRRIYDHFGMEMTPDYAAVLDAETAKARRFRSNHRYSLEQYGLTKDDIYGPLAEAFDELGFER